MVKTTCKSTGCKNSDPSWKQCVGYAMMPLDDHVWVSDFTISCEEAKVLEALHYDHAWSSGVCCGSRHQQINRRFVNNGVILEKYNEAINLVFSECFLSFCPSGGRTLQDPAS